ncbi:MAG TPA: lipoate--protein ligase family protein [Hellea balneolensis]|uniref:Lipoate--protein ligase family protein n=1 Tax=Hellea balneolensis TaxID=287478 RepID=A0A7C5LZF9_9PROT|nr:lipoate--protein ligase family protein [Hellea balneolensis]
MTYIRVIDTGLRTGRENIAHDQAMVECRVEGLTPDSFKFIHFKPCALVGRHQSLSQELKLDACERLGVQTVRRVTGGGAIYLDEGQLGWALVCDRRILGTPHLADITREVCTAAAKGLSTLGIEAEFRPRNDIEVGGQKISGTGGFFDGNILIFQGTVLIDLNPERMMSVLNVPAHKLKKRELESAAQRVTCLRELLGYVPAIDDVQQAIVSGFESHFGFDMCAADLDPVEEERAKLIYDEEIGRDEFVREIDNPGARADVLSGTNEKGNLTAYIRLDGAKNDRIREVIFTGDVFVTPPRTLFDLEAHLRGKFVRDVRAHIASFFELADIGMISLQPSEFTDAIEDALS